MSEKIYKVKCLKEINISGVPRREGEEVMVTEKDARDLVLRKRVIALNFHIDYNRSANIVTVVEGTTKSQQEKIDEYMDKEEKKKKNKEEAEDKVDPEKPSKPEGKKIK